MKAAAPTASTVPNRPARRVEDPWPGWLNDDHRGNMPSPKYSCRASCPHAWMPRTLPLHSHFFGAQAALTGGSKTALGCRRCTLDQTLCWWYACEAGLPAEETRPPAARAGQSSRPPIQPPGCVAAKLHTTHGSDRPPSLLSLCGRGQMRRCLPIVCSLVSPVPLVTY